MILNKRKRFSVSIAGSAYALAMFFRIDFIGRLMVAEIIALVVLFQKDAFKLIKDSRGIRAVIYGYVLFLISLIASDWYNETHIVDSVRGWSSIIFGVISTLFLATIFRKNLKVGVLSFLMCTSFTAFIFSEGAVNLSVLGDNTNYFKIRFVPFLMPAVAVVSLYLWGVSDKVCALFIFVVGLIFVVLDARSSGLILIATSIILILCFTKYALSFRRVLLLSSAGFLLMYGLYVIYVGQVLQGNVGGLNAQQLIKLSNPYNPFELLFIGRSEVFVSLKAISDRPLIGFGSWAKDKTGLYAEYFDGLHGQINVYRSELIPGHSMLFGAWLWSGVLGGVGMLMVGKRILKTYLYLFRAGHYLMPVITIYFFAGVWAFFFSPVGHIRTSYPFLIALLIAAQFDTKKK